MKKYHFQENEKDFGSTVRLDAINDKVKEIKKKEETDELGDANEFLNVFESENSTTLRKQMEIQRMPLWIL